MFDCCIGSQLSLLYCHRDACSKWRHGDAGVFDCCIGRKLSFLYCHRDACSKWRHGDAGVFDCCIVGYCPCCIVTVMLAQSGDMAMLECLIVV